MPERLTLTELQLLIRDSLYLSMPQMFWVTAEISEITVNASGHCYLELVEKHPDEKNLRARIRGIIWNSRFGFIRSYFENITGETLKTGLKILIRAKIEYHEVYGLSLVINDIDPAFTMGDMAIKRQLIIRKLEEEGVFTMNRELEFPVLPQKIAVISSRNAAGYTDFINHLNNNSFGYAFYTALIDTPMQGSETEQGVLKSLDKIAEYADIFDLVVIIRGGGSQTDLSWFDSYDIAYHVTQFPLPVLTGIGHEKNLSVTDMVAFRSLKTPTAVADFIIDGMNMAENRLIEMGNSLRDLTDSIINENRSIIETYGIKLLPLARYMIASNRERLTLKILDLTRSAKEITSGSGLIAGNLSSGIKAAAKSFSKEKTTVLSTRKEQSFAVALSRLNANTTKLAGLESSLKMLDPANVLNRGYTITSLNGIILKKKEQLETGDIIETRFADGKISSEVVEK
jgi:exodeoxyribonuclease VII large subunit